MRKIVANFFISLDGVVESPEKWHFTYFDDAMGQVVGAGMAGQTAFLMGRNVYDAWAAHWPSQGSDEPFADYINNAPKYVVTHRPLDEPVWTNATAFGPDVTAEIRALKAEGEGDIGMSGSAETVRFLIAEGLLDELNLLVHPIVVGSGQRLFEGTGTIPLELASSATLPTGVLHLVYRPAAQWARTSR